MKNKNFGNLFFTCAQKRFQTGKRMCQIVTSGGRLNRHRKLSTRLNYYPKIFYILFTIFILTSLVIISPILFGRSPLLTHGATMYTVTLDPYDGEFQGPLPAGWTLNANGTASKQVQENTAIGTMPTPIGRWGSAFTDYYKKRSYFDESVPIVGQATIRSDTVVTGNMTGYAQYNTKYIVSGSGPEDDELAKIKERLGISANSGVAEWWIFSERDGKYLINSEDELHWLSYLCATLNWANMDCYPEDLGLPDPLKSHYVLEKDLDMRDYYFMPIGNPFLKNDKDGTIFCEFKGTFDGQGHTISNLHTIDLVRTSGVLIGGLYGAGNMFGAIKNATIKNINFENVDIQNEHAALIGIIENSTVENVNVLSGKVIGYYSAAAIASNGHPLSAAYVDGAPVMIGNGNNIFKNCKNYADVSIRTGRNYDNERSNMAAGIFPTHNYDTKVSGQTYTANFIGCENHGKIQGAYVAGISIGGSEVQDHAYNDELIRNNILFNFSGCKNYGEIIRSGYINTAGIVIGTKGNIDNCENYYSMTDAYNDNSVFSGIVHYGYGNITNCINYGNSLKSYTYAANDFHSGIVSVSHGDITGCYNYGDGFYAGIVGENYGDVDYCINYAEVGSGIFKKNYGNVSYCINYGNLVMVGRDPSSGIGYQNYGSIDSCINAGDCMMAIISSFGYDYKNPELMKGGNITNCINTGKCYYFIGEVYGGRVYDGIYYNEPIRIENCYNFTSIKINAQLISEGMFVVPFIMGGYNYKIINSYSLVVLDFSDMTIDEMNNVMIPHFAFGSKIAEEGGRPVPENIPSIVENSGSCMIINSPVDLTKDQVVDILEMDPSMKSPSITNSYYYVTCNNNVLYSEIMAEQAAFNKEFIAVKFNAKRFGLELRPEIEELIKYLAIPHSLFAIGEGRADAEDAYSKIPVVA